ncbi:hypothetical protein BKH41_08355 [Helicobacter sp. 12S02232-10]|uniref:indole-3-glycerol phosphate synthase n=1 Tax=Helicobacter sp. 12S02232-10 TaxID=1476197 RepID=UPI000BA4F9E2|nr:indole-3-glycerol phosphate synthase [Helicobacter sp. 12S02232-10]PAF46870.1 hypothetical protein BKH41_08355 [Helicobacter sp. 12S02232-10]
MSYTSKSLENLKQSLKDREKLLSFDFLGRSLAYNPYMPRAQVCDFKRSKEQDIADKMLFCPPFSDEKLSFLLKYDSKAIALDFTSVYEQGAPPIEVFDCLAHLRRYSEKFIIHSDIFIQPYQLLESVVYGSDGVILEAGLLGKDLGSMYDFARRLGLLAIVKITSLKELKAAIFVKAEMIYIAQDFSNLLSFCPNSKIIFCDLPLENFDLNKKSSYGVDMFLVRDEIK